MRKTLVKGGGTFTIFVVVVFAAFFIWIAVSTFSSMPLPITIFLILAVLLFLMIPFVRSGIIPGGDRKVSKLFEQTTVSDVSLSFPEELEYEVGTVTLNGYWSSSTGSRRYYTKREFKASKRKSKTSIEFPKKPFKALVLMDGTGRVETPAARILSGPYKDVLLIFLTDEGEVTGSGSLTLSRESDIVTVTFRGEGRELRGGVQAELSKARKVRIEVGSGEVWKRIAEGQSFTFSFSPLPEEKTVVFANYKTVSPLSLIKNLWKNTTVFGHGTFELKAVLDVPLAKDVVEKVPFRVEKERESVDEN